MASGDVWKVIMMMSWGTVECRSGFHLIEGAGGGGLDPSADVAAAVDAALGIGALDGFSSALTLASLQVEDVQPGTTPSRVHTIANQSGSDTDVNPLPPQSAGVITWQTAVKPITGAFAANGRLYMPGIPQDGQISGFLQVGFQDSLSAFASLLFGAFVLDGTAYQLNIVSYTPNSKPRTIRAFNPVTSFGINNIVRSQRRREFGVGI